ncbi:hypothetical protein Bca52824_024237 [Brassica carinata]|uniref:Zinc finger GRF-type domain-containing protein n=1 Tax=Brassica carinata TaxID=52824 RepID=A0A8X7VJU4_BRACI|nr:hypothetical protein Bca52824_024237 [Brassica carinata]
MDPAEERRDSKKQKDYCDMLHFVQDSLYEIPRRCACGGRIIDEVARKEDYDSLPGKRFFTCDDGLHYRHPWVVGLQEEIQKLTKHLEEAEEVILGVWKLNKRIEALEEQVSSLTVDVGTLEKVCFD